MVNRAQMRYNLLDSWSRNQQSCYADSLLGFLVEITFRYISYIYVYNLLFNLIYNINSGNTVIAISSEKETEVPNWSDLKNILK
jgi:hypothetical protein